MAVIIYNYTELCMASGFPNHVIHGMDLGHYMNVKIVIPFVILHNLIIKWDQRECVSNYLFQNIWYCYDHNKMYTTFLIKRFSTILSHNWNQALGGGGVYELWYGCKHKYIYIYHVIYYFDAKIALVIWHVNWVANESLWPLIDGVAERQ